MYNYYTRLHITVLCVLYVCGIIDIIDIRNRYLSIISMVVFRGAGRRWEDCDGADLLLQGPPDASESGLQVEGGN